MIHHLSINQKELLQKIKHQQIALAGNAKLKIYGTLHCASGKRMKKQNRVFFVNEIEAAQQGYRPCGHCMNEQYKHYKNGII